MQRNEGQRVFYVSAIIILILVALGAMFPEGFGEVASRALGGVSHYFGWFYLLSVTGILIYLALDLVSRRLLRHWHESAETGPD